ncbi:TonB-dependent receptor plug domain-containing protein [Dokdonella ginsengisoli]|uniref:TonB-dependent receptor plug domain-containing protein n=1 Tax=Dokdonella ginsengisoli TaxID=363846 RepID=A0ABV9QQZ8_9GAMM
MSKGKAAALTVAIVSAIVFATAGAAAEEPAADGAPVVPLGVVEVIGSAGDAMPPGADVLDIEDIRAQSRRNVAEALDLLPGVTRQNFGQRRDTLVNVRGFDSRQVTLYVDGVPVYVPYDGNLDLARLGVEDLSRIVVTKGLTSVLYGPNALGGSINLVSRRPQREFEGSVYGGFDVDRSGDLPAYRLGGRVGTNQGSWYAQASASWQDADDFELPSGFPRSANQPDGRRANSGARDLDLSLKLGWTPNATDEYALNFYRVDDEKQTPPYAGHAAGVSARYWRWPKWDKDGVYFLSRTRIGESADLGVRLYYDSFQNELRSYDDATYTTQRRPYAFTSLYDDHTYGFSVSFEQRWSESQITRMALHGKQDFHRENDSVGAPWERFKDRTWSAALEHEWRPDAAWTITPGVSWNLLQSQRADDLRGSAIVPFEVGSDVAFNGQLVAAWQASEGVQVYAGVSRKTRFPTLKDRYSYRLGSAIPNPGLKPEDSDNLEIGVQGTHGAFDYKAALFDSRLREAIQSVTLAADACTSPPCSQLRNVGRARHRGVELSAGLELSEAWSVRANYGYVQRRNVSQPTVKPTDTPRQKLFAALDYRFAAGWRATLSADAESKRYSDSFGARVAGGFTLVDASVRGPVAGLDLGVGVRNAFDRRYAYQEGFPEAGRTFFVELGKHF